jgi:aldose 1-epimerase
VRRPRLTVDDPCAGDPEHEVRIGGEPLEVVVLPGLGARMHRLRAFGHEILLSPDDPATYRRDPFMSGSYVMAPWCNRLEPSPIEVDGRTVALGVNFVDGTAIHGQVYLRPWAIEAPGSFVVVGGGDGWPWRYEVRQQVTVVGAVLRVALTLTNLDGAAMPAGIGLHPWFLKPIEVAIRGESVYLSNLDTSPKPIAVSGTSDLRAVGTMVDGLDGTWADVATTPVELHWPDLGIRAEMRVEAPSLCIVAASPGDRPAVAVEPETHAPQGLRRLLRGEPDALTMLPPGERLALVMELAFERT